MTENDNGESESEREDSEEPEYAIEVNNKLYELNEEIRETIEERARREYEENSMFSCWWKTASSEQYEDGEWEDTIHDEGDPVLVIETAGPMVPWERLDTLDVQMQEVGPQSELDRQMDEADTDPNETDNGNGVKSVPKDEVSDNENAVEDSEPETGRTHFRLTPKEYEEIPDPDGEDPDKIPAAPMEMDGDPALIWWVPDHPDIEHTWTSGKAVAPMQSWVEWNVQKKADQPRISEDKATSHDHWESLLKYHECEVVAKMVPRQDVPGNTSTGEPDEREEPEPLEGKYGGDNWTV